MYVFDQGALINAIQRGILPTEFYDELLPISDQYLNF